MTAVLTAVMFAAGSVWAGNLTPPGAPGATMKTLDQVEPRIPVVSAPITLSASGSYYLTTNLSGTVTISADNVTLDLMGYAIVASSGNAISQNGARKNLLVRNGILSAPSGNGVDFSTSMSGANGVLEDLRVTGCANYGLVVGGGYTVRRCHISGVTLAGIGVYGDSRISDNTIVNCGTGIELSGTGAYVADNIVKGNTDNYDFSTGNQLNLLLCEIPETLDWPCSVKLAGTLSMTNTGVSGITVAANDVTIDMAGHTLIGPGASSGHGIYQADIYRNLRVFNGKAVEWQGLVQAGIYAAGTGTILSDLQTSTNYYGIVAGSGSTISDCTANRNGDNGINAGLGSTLSDCAAYNNGDDGIFADAGSTLSDCSARYNGDHGIWANSGSTFSDCAAYNNGDDGIYAGVGSTISDCAAMNNGNDGIDAGSGSTLSGCAARSNGGDGILAGSGSTLSDCAASYNTGDGMQVFSDSRVVGCVCHNNGFNTGDGAGIHATSSDNRIEGNTCTDNDRGIDVDTSGNFIVKNSCSGNTTEYDIVGGNDVGTIQTTPVGAGAWDNFEF